MREPEADSRVIFQRYDNEGLFGKEEYAVYRFPSLIRTEALCAFPKPLTPNSIRCGGANTNAPRHPNYG